jgi:phosphate transport system permease protein
MADVRDPMPLDRARGLSTEPLGGHSAAAPVHPVADGRAGLPFDPLPPEDGPEEQQPTNPARMSRRDRRELLVSAAAGVSASACLCALMDWTHPLTFAIWAVLWFLVATWLTARDTSSPVVATDRLVTTLVWLSGVVAVGVLVWMVAYVAVKGVPGLDVEFFTSDLSDVGPLDPGGGAFHAIVGTLEQVLIASVIAIPAALLTAVYLNEIKGRMSPVIRFVVDAMSGLPSIVAGLFIYTLFVTPEGFSLGWGYSGFNAGLALAILMIPIVTRAAEEMLRTVDDGLRESALALGSPQWRTALRIVLPTARAGLITASILGVARAVGETAPVLLTAFGSDITNLNPFSGAQSDLPLFIYQLLTKSQGNEAQLQRAWSGAVVLLMLVLALFVAARWIGNRGDRRRGLRR